MTNTSSPTRGRPSKLTPALVDSLVQAVEAGMSRADAADFAGISSATFARWLSRGRQVLYAGGAANEYEVRCATLRLRIGVAYEARKPDSGPAANPDKITADVIKASPLPAGAVITAAVGPQAVSDAPEPRNFSPVIVVGKPRRRSLIGLVRDRFRRDRVHRI
ncbi:hypothetical protein ACWGH2_41980 [Streptomyces sp. NPDC054871]